MTILQRLSEWQKHEAATRGVEGYMIVPFGALKAIAAAIPKNEEELLDVKGIGPAKVRKYGSAILMICGGAAPAMGSTLPEEGGVFDAAEAVSDFLDGGSVIDSAEKPQIDFSTGEILGDVQSDDVFTVGGFLGQLNQILGSYFSQVRVRGEIIGFKRNQNGHAYFEIKDDTGILRTSVFKNAYDLSGVMLSDGQEVIVTGTPSHHEKYGFSFIGSFVEYAGEGTLKKAYDALKQKMSAEGLLSDDRKRALPELPERVGLITSPTGAAIGDFTTNVGQYGYKIFFAPATVEGAKAVPEILKSLKALAKADLDVLVITRGGGSLESLAAFNNENVVRAIAEFPVPVIAGIGHEQDETIATLVADHGVSTPTAAARAVRASWDEVLSRLSYYEQTIIGGYEQILLEKKSHLGHISHTLAYAFGNLIASAQRTFESFDRACDSIESSMALYKEHLVRYEHMLQQYNPERQLKQGYSIVRDRAGKIVRSVGGLSAGDTIDVQLADGEKKAVIK